MFEAGIYGCGWGTLYKYKKINWREGARAEAKRLYLWLPQVAAGQ